eukprot:TRINITY_DN33547_c0_g1_i2.p1 TRINITY_DN33547_c0_g1~~TRINITY_DN33547_c0_g1_i2.p1  ORF type:complete len:961 (-),score=175.95 TRINITY_DN33547_c0_g1_i2:103-2985(-)
MCPTYSVHSDAFRLKLSRGGVESRGRVAPEVEGRLLQIFQTCCHSQAGTMYSLRSINNMYSEFAGSRSDFIIVGHPEFQYGKVYSSSRVPPGWDMRDVLPWVFQQVDRIGRISELRLLKLLVNSAMHRWMYTNMRLIGKGMFASVWQSGIAFGSNHANVQVAIKDIPKQGTIKDRSHLYDVYNEITCLDTIRFEDHVCHVYDYGLEESSYWIVMKYYASNLKKWRDSLPGTMTDHLPVLLAVFKQILKAVALLHKNDIVHYDLKCENIMIEMPRHETNAAVADPAKHAAPEKDSAGESQEDHGSPVPPLLTESAHNDGFVPRIALVDFGESRMMANADDLDLRNRGTELTKGPEMLELDRVGKRDNHVHDRRRRIGTDKSSDIWSLGCLFFEVMTGRYLFLDYDIPTHYACVTGVPEAGDVVNEDNEQRLDGNKVLIDYVRFLLIRDTKARCSIEQAIARFESVTAEALRDSGMGPLSPGGGSTMRRLLSGSATPDTPRSIAHSLGSSSALGLRSRTDLRPDRPLACAAAGAGQSYFAQVLTNLCVLEVSDEDLLGGLGALKSRLGQHAWTHMVDFRLKGAAQLPFQTDLPHVLKLPWSSPPDRSAQEFLEFLPHIFDFLRHAAILQGTVLFVDGYAKVSESSSAATASTARGGSNSNARRGGLAMSAVLALLTETYHLGVYAALSYLSSQLLVAALRPDAVAQLACWQEEDRIAAWARGQSSVRVACLCGACCWHVPRAWLDPAAEARGGRNSHLVAEKVSCSCNSAVTCAAGRCPNRGSCESYKNWLYHRYGFSIRSVRWLWLPPGITAGDCSAGVQGGIVTRDLEEQAEPVGEPERAAQAGGLRSRRFRCRICQVLTHAEVYGAEASDSARTVLVTSYEHLRLGRLQGSKASAGDDVEVAPLLPAEAVEAPATVAQPGASKSDASGMLQRSPPQRLPGASLAEVALPAPIPGVKELL